MIAIWIVCTVAAAIWAARATPGEASGRRRVLIAAAAFGPALLTVQYGLRLAAGVLPDRYDQFLFAINGPFGFHASFLLGRWFARWPIPAEVCKAAYNGLHIAILVLLLHHARQDPKWRFARALAANFLIAYGLYFLLPAAGPAYAFAGYFPSHPPLLPSPAVMPLHALPNAMPSVHFATALLLYWNSGLLRFGRPIFGVYLLLVTLATLGTGEHYLIDLVVAMPYAATVQSLARSRPSLPAAALTLGWVLLLRFRPDVPIHEPVTTWALTIVTVALSVAAVRHANSVGRPTATGANQLGLRSDYAAVQPVGFGAVDGTN